MQPEAALLLCATTHETTTISMMYKYGYLRLAICHYGLRYFTLLRAWMTFTAGCHGGL